MPDSTPLAHLRVLECANWNVVFAGRLLADAGADVVRVVPASGDPLEGEPPFFGDSKVSIQAAYYNAGKRVVRLDLGSDEGKRSLLELAAGCDMLFEDWDPSDQPVTDDELAAAAPNLVRVSVTPFGRSESGGFLVNDLIQNALSGSAGVTGNSGTPPLNGWGNQTHHTVGLYAAISALAALQTARATGTAQHVDLSAHEALVSCTEQVLMEWFFRGPWGEAETVAPRQGSLHWSAAYEVYPGNNGQGVMVSVALRFMESILPWLIEDGAAQDLADTEKYPNILAVVKDLPHVMDVMREWVATKDPVELFFESQRRGLSWGVVLDVPAAVSTPQIEARKWFEQQDLPSVGSVPFPGRAIKTDADGPHPKPGRRAAPSEVQWEPRHIQPEGGSASPTKPLAGIRVLDFTHVLAGPFGTRVLADLGADVIKLSSASRAGGANSPSHPYYASWNRNKRSVNVDMRTDEGRQVARRLADECDIIIENFSAGVLARWGLDRESVARTNPGVTVISMNGMGKTGPWSNFLTFAPTIHALAGLTYLTNPPGRHDLGYGFSLTDHLSGLAGALASLQAIEYRRRTGQGLDIDLSQYELGLAIMGPTHMDYLVNGEKPEPVGNRDPFGSWAPHGIYRAAGEDEWIAVSLRGDQEWQRLCETIGQSELAHDARFATHAARLASQDELDEVVQEWTSGRDRYDAMAALQAAGIHAGAVQNADDLMMRDQWLARRGFFGHATPAEGWGAYKVDKFPALFNGERPETYEGVHQLGEDTFDVLTGVLNLTDGDVAELMSRGILS